MKKCVCLHCKSGWRSQWIAQPIAAICVIKINTFNHIVAETRWGAHADVLAVNVLTSRWN